MNRVHHAWRRLDLRSALHRRVSTTGTGSATALATRTRELPAAAVVAESLPELNASYIDALNCLVDEDREDLMDELSDQYLRDVVELLISGR
jgi:hypothetical protein